MWPIRLFVVFSVAFVMQNLIEMQNIYDFYWAQRNQEELLLYGLRHRENNKILNYPQFRLNFYQLKEVYLIYIVSVMHLLGAVQSCDKKITI